VSYEVYLSSTLKDLENEREAVRQALSDECVVKHSYTASENAVVDSCLQDVADCDVYVLILGMRYGYVPQRELNNPDNLSITELEYQRASNKPRLVFIKETETVPFALTDAATKEHPLERIEGFRERAAKPEDQRAVFFRTADDLKLAVVKAFNRFKEERTAKGNILGNLLPPQSADLLTGPLTIGAVLKGAEHEIIDDAYPTGDQGVHFRFSLFNQNAFHFLVHEVRVDVLAFAPLNLDHLLHGVGATDVERSFQATILPELGSYRATYLSGGRQGEYVKIPPSESEKFDVEIAAPTEGLYDVCVRILGGSAGRRFDVLLHSTKRRVSFFDVKAGYMVDRRLGGRMLTYAEYSEEMKSWRKGGY
jgi:hypothetical protein